MRLLRQMCSIRRIRRLLVCRLLRWVSGLIRCACRLIVLLLIKHWPRLLHRRLLHRRLLHRRLLHRRLLWRLLLQLLLWRMLRYWSWRRPLRDIQRLVEIVRRSACRVTASVPAGRQARGAGHYFQRRTRQ